MLSNHINQFVHLKAPEFPKVFTNFEDQIGEYSVAYKRAKSTFTIISKVVKNEYNYDSVSKDKVKILCFAGLPVENFIV